MSTDIYAGFESDNRLSIYRPISEYSRQEIMKFANVLQVICPEFTRTHEVVSSVGIISRKKFGLSIERATIDSPVMTMEPETYEACIADAVASESSFYEKTESEIRQKKGKSKVSIFKESGLINVSLDLTDGTVFEEIRRGHDEIEHLTNAGLVVKPGRIWLGTVRSIDTKDSGFKDGAEDILNSRDFDLDYIELESGVVKKSFAKNIESFYFNETSNFSTQFLDSLRIK